VPDQIVHAAKGSCRESRAFLIENLSIASEWPLPRIHLFPTAGLEKKNYQPVCVLNLEKLSSA
jgi:hypothetical protein